MFNLLAVGAGNTALSIILAVIILFAMICVHESGHFVAGRILHFKIDEFAIGFGPPVLKRRSKKSGTLFSVRALPLGGYCAFADEGEDGKNAYSFNSKKPWQRIIVLLFGAFFNYVLAMILVCVAFFAFGQPCYKMGAIKQTEGVGVEFSLQEGDVIVGVQGHGVYSSADLIYALKGKAEGEAVAFTVVRSGETVVQEVCLRADCDFKNSSETSKLWRALGSDTYEGADGNLYWSVGSSYVKYSFFKTIGKSFAYSFKTAGAIFRVLGELITGNLSISAMGGPITTIRLTGQMAVQGLCDFLLVAAYIGVNLAVFNLLPIPSLDGSKVVFCLIEWIFKKPVPRKVESAVHVVGLVLIIAFAVFIDILQFARC